MQGIHRLHRERPAHTVRPGVGCSATAPQFGGYQHGKRADGDAQHGHERHCPPGHATGAGIARLGVPRRSDLGALSLSQAPPQGSQLLLA